MKIYEKIRKRMLEEHMGYTLSNSVFLPMLFASENEVETILSGNIKLSPMADDKRIKELLSKIPNDYFCTDEWEAVKHGGFVNLADFTARQLSMYPIVFEEGKFLKINKRFRDLGNTAIVILYPDLFIQRIQMVLGQMFANQYYVNVSSAQYRGLSDDPYKYSMFDRSKKDRWKREIITTARLNSNIRLVSMDMVNKCEPIYLELGNLSDIAVECPVSDLILGKVPAKLLESEYTSYLSTFSVKKKEIREWVFLTAANVMNIVPTMEWMEKLKGIFEPDEWRACSQVEKLFVDGEGMPRLAYFYKNGMDKVFIHINKLECHFFDYGDKEKTLLEKLIRFIEIECETRFCHMSLETNADLGVVEDKKIISQTHFYEERICHIGELFEFQSIEADYKLVPSIFGIDFPRRDWHYKIRLFTPDNEHTLWYEGADILKFYSEAAERNLKRIDYLMKGNAYGRYRKIR